jgi:hypothetical protein
MRRKMGDVIEKVCLIGMLAMVAAGAMFMGVNANQRRAAALRRMP